MFLNIQRKSQVIRNYYRVLSKGQAIYGEGSSLNQIVSRSGPIGIKNLVENISKNRGFADGGLVDKRNKLLANIAASKG